MKESPQTLLLSAIQQMDLVNVDILLDPNLTYQDATKVTFLRKLKGLFAEFQEGGDSSLVAHEGFCNSALCSNRYCTGYSFVGNKINRRFDLIVKEHENEIADLFHCNGFDIRNKSIMTEGSIDINIYDDEKASFIPTDDYLKKFTRLYSCL